VLSLDAFIGMPPVGCGVGHPFTYQYDITLILDVNGGEVLKAPAGVRRIQSEGDCTSDGTIYPLLNRLRDAGLVTSRAVGLVRWGCTR
jgi:DNA-binding PadR family transcriptional regulator